MKVLDEESRVEALIDASLSDWNKEFIHQIFNKDEAETICGIPNRSGDDKHLIWWSTKDEKFSIKFACHL